MTGRSLLRACQQLSRPWWHGHLGLLPNLDTPAKGINKVLTPAGVAIDGNGGNNYSVTFYSVSTGIIGPYITTATPLPNANIAQVYTVGTPLVTLQAVWSAPYTWAKIAGLLPPGLTLNSDGTITGTVLTYGTYTFTARVTDSLAQTDTKVFSITINGAIITVTSPNGGENWNIGDAHTITWTCSTSFASVGANVNIQLSRDGGLTWTTILFNVPNLGSRVWVVYGPTTTQALIRVVSVTYPYVYDTSNATFTISPPAG